MRPGHADALTAVCAKVEVPPSEIDIEFVADPKSDELRERDSRK